MGDFLVQDGQLFLFQGDSITDCGRRGAAAPYGSGYASIFRELVIGKYPGRDIRFINKGIGGDKTIGLRDRWEDDVIRHQPDWLSILIGINDLHTTFGDPVSGVTVDVYRQAYTDILTATQEKTEAQIILLDPFYISVATSPDSGRKRVLDLLPEYIAVVHEMVEKFGARHIKTHEIYQEHLKYRDADYYCPEPVHPNHAGHIVMASALMDVLSGE